MMDGEHLWRALHLNHTHLGPPDVLQGREVAELHKVTCTKGAPFNHIFIYLFFSARAHTLQSLLLL